MPGRLDRINQILTEVEHKGTALLETLAGLDNCQVEPGRVEILGAGEGRAFFRRQSNGLPIWSDLTLVNRNSGGKTFDFNLDFNEYNAEYTGLKARQLAATQDKFPLDATDALEALTLATLVRDIPVIEALINRLAIQFPALPETMRDLAGRGNTRLRSVYGRILALMNQEAAWQVLQPRLLLETSAGVRADIITATILNSQTNEDGLPVAILEEWLTGDNLIDPLSCVLALTGLGLQLSPDIFGLIQPQHQDLLKAWFKPEPATIY
ncbi:MAG: hypothetical protein JWP00_4031 [Chloroflexi bacterium]|jgi:hypothetical protein|nr:hypothetical protein [Chloroflexota bacterium]